MSLDSSESALKMSKEIVQATREFPLIKDSRFPALEYISRHALSHIFFSHFFFKEFPKLIQNTSSIEYNRIIEYLRVSDVEASSLIFKLVAIMDAVNRPKEALMFINNLLESCFEKSLIEKGYVLIEFVFYFARKKNFTELNSDYYTQVKNQLTTTLADQLELLNQFSIVVQQKYEAIFMLVEFFEMHFVYTESDLKLLKVLISATTPDKLMTQSLRKISDEAILTIAFNNPQIAVGLENLDRKIERAKFKIFAFEVFNRLKVISALMKSFAGINMNFYVMKFNHRSKTKRTFRYLCLRSHLLAVVSKSTMENLPRTHNRKGICKLIRRSRFDSEGLLRSLHSEIAQVQISTTEGK